MNNAVAEDIWNLFIQREVNFCGRFLQKYRVDTRYEINK